MTDETRPQPERPAAPPKPLQSLALDGFPGLEAGAACDIDDPDCDPATGRPAEQPPTASPKDRSQ